jgi:hypothetical protein
MSNIIVDANGIPAAASKGPPGRIQIVSGNRPQVGDLLAAAGLEDEIGGLGGSIRGWSALSLPARCWRLAYYRLISGLRSKRASDAIDVGILYHACMATHFATGGKDTFKPLLAVQDGIPEIAKTVRRMIEARMARCGHEDARLWDVRAIEQEVVAYVEGVPTSGKYAGQKICAPMSSKFDAVIAKREPNGPYAPAGPVSSGVWIVDWKTTGRLSRDKISGFGMSPQLMLMVANWKLAGLDAVYGPLNGMIIEVITSTKDVAIERLEIVVEDRDAERFKDYITPWALELESMLAADERDDVELWPMNFANCLTPYTCTYFDLCESHGAAVDLYDRPPDFVPARGLVQQARKPAPQTAPSETERSTT